LAIEQSAIHILLIHRPISEGAKPFLLPEINYSFDDANRDAGDDYFLQTVNRPT
jgi:hypothetical protein